jgi:hypothetical protein
LPLFLIIRSEELATKNLCAAEEILRFAQDDLIELEITYYFICWDRREWEGICRRRIGAFAEGKRP